MLLLTPLLLVPDVSAFAQNEQHIPVLVYRTGAYAVSGNPFANGTLDYYTMINERDGGINGVKIVVTECETGYATDRGLECFRRLKDNGLSGAAFVNPMSTGVAYQLTDTAPSDRVPIVTPGYGGAMMKDGTVFPWNFPLLGTYWTAADIAIQHIAHELGGVDRLKQTRIVLLFHDSPYGREPIPMLGALADKFGFSFRAIPVPHPGLEQEAQWREILRDRPDYVLLWGWGEMNGAAIRQAAASGFPRERMIGVWFSGSEPDVRPAGADAVGYKSLMLQHGSGKFAVHSEIERYVYGRGKGSAQADEIGEALYNRGLIAAVLGVEAIRKAQEKFGQRPLTGEEVRWGFEHLEIDATRVKELGLEGMIAPIKLSCADHEGAHTSRIQQWDGTRWNVISDWYTADETLIDPLVHAFASAYAEERGIIPRDCSIER